MYRIRSASGIETSFASLDEFTAAVQRGGVSSSDQIYHSRADRWLDIKSHPHYRLAMQDAQSTNPPPVHQAEPSPGRTQVMAKPRLQREAAPALVEDGFMVMSTGLDYPMRTAGGSRATVGTPEPQAAPKPRDVVRVMPRVTVPAAPPPVAAVPLVHETAPAAAPIAVELAEPPAAPVPPPVTEPAVPTSPPSLLVEPGVAPVQEVRPAGLADGWTSSSPEAPGRGSPKPFLIGGAIAVVLAAVALLLWRPWSGPSTEWIAAQTVPQVIAPDTVLQEFAAAVVAAAASQPPEEARPPKPVEPQVLPAVRPDLGTDLSLPAADVGLDASPAASSAGTVAPSELARRIAAAEAEARDELRRALGSSTELFTPARLATLDGVRGARAAWAAAGNAIRSYRAAIARLESAYGDSLLQAQRAQRWPSTELRAWNARPSYAEPVETSQISDLMVDQVAEGLDLLASSSGQYQMRNGRIHFTAAGDAARYGVIQSWVSNRRQQWAAIPASTRPETITLLMKALGDGLPTP